jgi:hypothetical protein
LRELADRGSVYKEIDNWKNFLVYGFPQSTPVPPFGYGRGIRIRELIVVVGDSIESDAVHVFGWVVAYASTYVAASFLVTLIAYMVAPDL